MRFKMNHHGVPLGTYCLGTSLGCYMAFLYYSLMEATLEHTIAAFAFAVIGGLFIIAAAILLALNHSSFKEENYQREAQISDTIVTLSIVGTAIIIAVFVILSQVIQP